MRITKKAAKTMIIVCILFIAFIAIGCKKDEAATQKIGADSPFKVQFFVGDVKISRGNVDISPKLDDQLNINDLIITGSKAYIDILYGSLGIIKINENSKVSITAIAGNENNNTVMDMEKGRVFAALSKLKRVNFSVKTPTVVAAVRGTSFSVVNDVAGAKVAVLRGTVSAQPVKNGNVIEDKAIEVHENFKTDYIDEATVDKMAADNNKIVISKMTVSEAAELQNEAKDINEKIDTIQGLSSEEKEALRNEIAIDDSSAKKANSGQPKANGAADAAKREAEKKQQEAVAKKAKEEQTKKERISNIPTM